MKNKLNCILLVDDDEDCNFFHKRLFEKAECAEQIFVAENGMEALSFLNSTVEGKHPHPALIFLDINMPKMNGWEFLNEYKKLDDTLKAKIVVVMLTTSLNPDDRNKASNITEIKGFHNKYLTKDSIDKVLKEHFPTLIG